ncbi:MAG: hypothetical protein GY893_10730 [bacterium]|nr:hypothetical protein [bacterium]
MPQYRMVNPETGNTEDISCTIADMEAMKTQGWVTVFVPNPNSIISGRSTSGHGGGNQTSHAWKDLLGQIKKNNPKSTIDV